MPRRGGRVIINSSGRHENGNEFNSSISTRSRRKCTILSENGGQRTLSDLEIQLPGKSSNISSVVQPGNEATQFISRPDASGSREQGSSGNNSVPRTARDNPNMLRTFPENLNLRRSKRQINQDNGLVQYGPQLRKSERLMLATRNSAIAPTSSATLTASNSKMGWEEPKKNKKTHGETEAEVVAVEASIEFLAQSFEERKSVDVHSDQKDVKTEVLASLLTPKTDEPEPLGYNSVDTPEFQVFTNPLLFDAIASYLDYASLKALSSTGSLLLAMTRRCRRYINNTRLNILNESPLTKDLLLLQPGFLPWKTVRLDIHNWNYDQVKTLLLVLNSESVEALELHQPKFGYSEQAYDQHQKNKQLCKNYLVQLILSTQNLRSLKVDSEILVEVEDLFTPKLMEHLGSLETLIIHGKSGVKDWTPSSRMMQVIHLFEDRFRIIDKNISALSNVPEMRLRTFLFEIDDPPPISISNPTRYFEAVIRIIVQNQGTLEELRLHGDIWRVERMKAIECPSLLSLDVNMSADGAANLAVFIQKQPLLKNLTVRIDGLINTLELPNAIRMKSAKFRHLHVFWTLSTTPEPMLSFDWSFIEQLAYLENLIIRQPYKTWNQRNSLSELMLLVPSSLRKVSINGFYFGNGIEQRDSISVSCLARLTRLTTLDLKHTRNAITDTVLQFICSNMTQLLELKIYNCEHITDFGITGKRENEEDTGISLSRLKGLRKLRILNCTNVSFLAIRSVVAFLELKELRISSNGDRASFTPALLFDIAIQNTCLEVFQIGHSFPAVFPTDELKLKMQEYVPRLTKLEIYEVREDHDDEFHLLLEDLDFDFSDLSDNLSDLDDSESDSSESEEYPIDSDEDFYN